MENKKSNKKIFIGSAVSFILCAILILFAKNSDGLQLITFNPYLTASLCSSIACASALLIGIIFSIIFNNKWGIFISIVIGIAGGALIGSFCANIITNGMHLGIKIHFFVLLCAMFAGIIGGIFGVFLLKIANSGIFNIKSFNKKVALINLFIWLLTVIAVPFILDYSSYETMIWASNLLKKAKINGKNVEIEFKSLSEAKRLVNHLYIKPKSTMINSKLPLRRLSSITPLKSLNGKKNTCTLKWETFQNPTCIVLILFSLNKIEEIKIPQYYIFNG